nr:YfhO family protein [Butyrivibrio sp.]
IQMKTGNHNGVFMTIPYEKDWSIKVDRKKVSALCVYDSMTYIPLENQGETHLIDMAYVPAGFYAGMFISVIGAALFAFIIIKEKRRV